MTISTLLEDFAAAAPELAAHEQKPEDLIGYSVGFAAGIAAASAKSEARNIALAESISSLYARQNARTEEAIQTLLPLFEGLVSQLIPTCLTETLHGRIMDLIIASAKNDFCLPMLLRVHPDNRDALAALACSADAPPFDVQCDPELDLTEAHLVQGPRETSLDITILHQEISTAITALIDIADKEVTPHG